MGTRELTPRRRLLVWIGLLFALGGSAAIVAVQHERDTTSLRQLVYSVARRHGIDPVLVEAVVRVESSGNPRAASHKQAYGLMQLLVPTASEMAERPVTVDELFVPTFNLELGCRFLRSLLRRYEGDVRLALMAYNAGMGNVDRWRRLEPDPRRILKEHAFRQTRAYVAKVLAFAETLKRQS